MRDHFRTGTEVLDGLRGAAILLVFVFHTWLFSWYTPYLTLWGFALPTDVVPRVGYFGVDLFFVISGFVLFFPHAIRAVSGAGTTHGPREFALRRVLKIVPSYAIALAFTALSLASLHKSFPPLATFALHAFFVNSFFDDPMGFANSVFWSLAIEAQFYVVFLPLAWLFRRFPIAVAIAMIAIALGYRFENSAHYLQTEPVYRELPAFLDVFAAGMFGAYSLAWLRAHVADSPRARIAFTLVALASAGAIWYLFNDANGVQYDVAGSERWDVYKRTPLALAFASFAVASCAAFPLWRKAIANPVLVFFSLISYNLYLWHTLVMIWLWKGNVLPHVTREPHDDDHWKFLFIAISWPLAIAISVAITYFFERPILSRIAPQNFAFDWSRAMRATRLRPSSASTEKST